MPKNNMARFRFDFENRPVLDVKKTIRGPEDLDDVFDDIKTKFFGKH